MKSDLPSKCFLHTSSTATTPLSSGRYPNPLFSSICITFTRSDRDRVKAISTMSYSKETTSIFCLNSETQSPKSKGSLRKKSARWRRVMTKMPIKKYQYIEAKRDSNQTLIFPRRHIRNAKSLALRILIKSLFWKILSSWSALSTILCARTHERKELKRTFYQWS